MGRLTELGAAQARATVLHALGFRRRKARASARDVQAVVERLGMLQLDPVNVLAPAKYLPVYSRVGPYDDDHLDRLIGTGGVLVDAWGHQHSVVHHDLLPLLRWRQDAVLRHPRREAVPADLLDAMERLVAERGPLVAADLEQSDDVVVRRGRGPWGKAEWRVDVRKQALRLLWSSGRLAVAGRRRGQQVLDLPERVLPREVLRAPTPSIDEARKALLVHAAQVQGLATAAELADHFSMGSRGDRYAPGHRRASVLLAELVEAGELEPVQVEGWSKPAYAVPGTLRRSGPGDIATLVSPFDPLLWSRDRVRRLFGFDYRLEIYVPAPLRVHGYYVLPFLLGDRLAARVDLKADRRTSTLRVLGSWREPGFDDAPSLAGELRQVAAWRGLEHVDVEPVGDLAREVTVALAALDPDVAANVVANVVSTR